jgi:signal transduction histidine kinase
MISTFIERKRSAEKIQSISRFPSENPNPVLRVDYEKVIYTNKRGSELFNVQEGSQIPILFKNSVQNALQTNGIRELEANINDRTYTLVITPVENESYVNIYGLDMTERKKAEERLSQLISTVSHELRTPITVLLMSMDYLSSQKESINKELEEKLMEGISRNIHLLNDLAEDILLVSRIDENKLELNLEELNLFEIVHEILYLMEPIGKEKNIEFDIDIDRKIHLNCDLKRIDQVFRIIIDNSIKYSNEGSRVEISAINEYEGKYNSNGTPGVLIKFKDYGRGIPSQDLPNIFERFFRSSNVYEIAGTGLGLAIAKELVNAHNGEIYLESELGIGTTFYLFFPQIEYYEKFLNI